MNEILNIKGLRGGYDRDVEILRGVDMSLDEGETVSIIGLNGSGKSTLGRAIMNMIPVRQVEIQFKGADVTDLSTTELVARGMSIMRQGGQVFTNLSVWENLELALHSGPEGSFEKLHGIIPMLGESRRTLQHMMADKLSGGQRHQLALAMALATAPDLVILDEPSAGLSPAAVNGMYDMLSAVREELKTTIILIEQNISRAAAFSGSCILLQNGRIEGAYPSSDLRLIEKKMFNDNNGL